MSAIVQAPHPVLRSPAQEVPREMLHSKELQTILSNMKDALSKEDDGVAIAAPQIGAPYRIFIVSKKASRKFKDDMVFINPEIVRIGRAKKEVSEGCLSVRWKYGLVKRATTATVRALNENGNEFVMPGEDLIAQIFQHEIDHLNGILFVDKARNIEDIPPNTYGK